MGLLDGFGGGPDDKVRAHPFPDFRHGGVLHPHMDPIRPAFQGHVHIVVDDERHLVPLAQGLDLAGFFQKLRLRQRLLPKLDQGDASL